MGLDKVVVVTFARTPPVALTLPPGGSLKLNGVGFKSFRRPGGWGVFQLGYSHYVGVQTPPGTLLRPRRGALAVGTPDVAARVRHLRRPDPYKHRGVHPREGDLPPLKQGKRR